MKRGLFFGFSVLCLSILLSMDIVAQSVADGTLKIPRTVKDETQSPVISVSELGNGVSNSMIYERGVAVLNIPLYCLQVGNWSMPISLSYETSGIKVDDEECEFGLGWRISCGGFIKRTVHGLPDEARGIQIKTSYNIQQNNDLDYLKDVLHREIDAQRDVYNYSLGGYSGSFIISGSNIVMLTQTDVKISQYDSISEGVRNFKAVLPDGTRYLLSVREHMQYSYHPQALPNVQYYLSPDYTAVVGWHVSSIITPSCTDTIHFEYTRTSHQRTQFEDNLQNAAFVVDGNNATHSSSHTDVHSHTNILMSDKVLLSSVRGRTGRLDFTSTAAPSVNGFAFYNSIDVVSPTNSQVRKIIFTISQFTGGRKRLDAVSVFCGSTLLQRYRLGYYSDSSSKDKDIFGYNNHIPGASDRLYNSILDEHGEWSGDRNFRLSSARYCALQTVTDALGMKTTFEYEGNTCDSCNIFGNNITVGLRIKSITTTDSVTWRTSKRQFQYEQSNSSINFNNLSYNSFIDVGGLINQYNLSHHTYSTGATFTSSCRTPGAQAEDAVIYYGKVTELITGTGVTQPIKTVYEYDLTDIGNPYIINGASNLPNMELNSNNERYLGSKIHISNQNLYQEQQRIFSSNFITGHFQSTCWQKAPLIRKTLYKYEGTDYQPLEREEHFYTLERGEVMNTGFFVTPTTRQTTNFNSVMNFEVLSDIKDFNFMETTTVTGNLFRDSTHVTHYYENGTQQLMSVVYSYNNHKNCEPLDHLPFYPLNNSAGSRNTSSIPIVIYPHVEGFDDTDLCPNEYNLLQSVKVTCGSNTFNRYFCYVSNISSSYIHTMTDSVGISQIAREKIVVNGCDTTLLLNSYQLFNGANNYQLSAQQLLHNNNFIHSRVFGEYDHRGRMLSTSLDGGLPISFVYNEEQDQPTAIVQGTGTALNGVTQDMLNNDTLQITQYTYEPLIGCTRIILHDGKSQFYSYTDSRLTSQTNLSGDIEQSYAYYLFGNTGRNCISQTRRTSASSSSGITAQTYFDGFGLAVNEVEKESNPSLDDLVTLTSYDALGRATEQWLPVPMHGVSSAVSRSSFSSSASSYYSDSKPYAKDSYTTSTEQKPYSTCIAGSVFHNHASTLLTNGNNGTSGKLSCQRFMLLDDYSFASDGFYPSGELQASCSTDADERSVIVFTDYRGQKILERRVIDEEDDEYADTYYIYDAMGNLCFVLPPALNGMLLVSGNSWDIRTCNPLRQYAYFYRYDERLDCVEKKLPGVSEQFFIYDHTHQPILSQDGNQRALNRWRFTLSNRFGRTSVEGICSLPDTAIIRNSWIHTGTPNFTSPSATICQTGYTANISLSSASLLQANYFDNYAFAALPQFSQLQESSRFTSLVSSQQSVRSLPTGSVTAVLPSGTPLLCANGYDGEDRIATTIKTQINGNIDIEDFVYSYTNQPLTRTIEHIASDSSLIAVGADLETYTYTYDHADRLLTTTHQLNGQTARTIASYTYDALGRPASLYQNNGVTTSYTYDMHGWVTSITNSKFSQHLYYEQQHNGSLPQYGGNLSAMDWKIGSSSMHGYTFTYDEQSFLSSANYYLDGTHKGYYSTQYTYDQMGNILYLKRKGITGQTNAPLPQNTYGYIDNLQFTYNGNQLKKVADHGSDPYSSTAFHFVDGANQTVEYTYDACGNMTSDLNKGITNIAYNAVGLPDSIAFDDGSVLKYTYAADGRKLSENINANPIFIHPTKSWNNTAYTGTTSHRHGIRMETDYCGYLQYRRGGLTRIDIDGGYIDVNGSTLTYNSYSLDHLGSVRDVSATSLTSKQVNHYYPFGGLIDISTGGDEQPYKYNGKELDWVKSLNLYDYHARQYDAAVGRFTTMDPLAEKYYSISPYAYCGNNPVNAIDPDGRDDWYLNQLGEVIERNIQKNNDTFFFVDENGQWLPNNSISFDYGTINNFSTQKTSSGILYDVYQIRGDNNATRLFEFAANHTKVEWSQAKLGVSGDKGLNFITTSHNQNYEYGMSNLLDKQLQFGYTIREMIHNHPRNNEKPSYKTMENNDIIGDIGFANSVVLKTEQKPLFFIFTSAKNKYTQYRPTISIPIIIKSKLQ